MEVSNLEVPLLLYTRTALSKVSSLEIKQLNYCKDLHITTLAYNPPQNRNRFAYNNPLKITNTIRLTSVNNMRIFTVH